MIETLLKEKDDFSAKRRTRFLSHSQVNRYLLCPEQYRLYYIEGMRLKVPKASLVFGQVLHQSLAFFFKRKDDPVKTFADTWSILKDMNLTYSQRESWEKLRDSGQGLLEKFLKEEFPRLGEVQGSEKRFELTITSLDMPFVGIIDLVAALDEKKTVVDFKTGSSAYEEHEVVLADQLSAYKLAEPDAEEVAFCVFIKTKTPKIEWYRTTRTGEQLTRYLAKVGYVAREISAGNFYQRSGKWCSYCDFLPVCLGDKTKIEETLVQIK